MRLDEITPAAAAAFVVGFLAAAFIALVATPFVRRYARRLDAVDRPEERRVNTRPVARGGGFAVAAGFLPVTIALLWLNGPGGGHFVEQPSQISSLQLVALLGGGVVAMAIGALDDLFQLRARWQLLGQLLVAVIAVAGGIVVGSLRLPFFGAVGLTGWLGIALTIFWIVGMINSINFIDGLDGLSSGIAIIASLTLGGISLTAEVGQPFVALFCFTLAGALAGFLRWNMHPASIFVGTSGIFLVGYLLATLSVMGTAKVAVALLVLGVPIIDTFWIIVRRVASGRSPFAPDRGHIHHRLLDLGLSHRGTVFVIYAVCVGLAVLSFVLSGTGLLYAFMGLFVLSGLALLLINRLGGDRSVDEDLEAATYEEAATGQVDEEAGATRQPAPGQGAPGAGATHRGGRATP